MKRSKRKKLKRKLRKTKRPHVARPRVEPRLPSADERAQSPFSSLMKLPRVTQVSKCWEDDHWVPVVFTAVGKFSDDDFMMLDRKICETHDVFIRTATTEAEYEQHGPYVRVMKVTEGFRLRMGVEITGQES